MSVGEDAGRIAAEARARVLIDRQLTQAGWSVQDKKAMNLFAAQGVAVREVTLKPGIAYQKALHRLRVRNPDEMNPDFLALMLTEAIRSGRHDHLYTGTTIKHLPQEKLRQIEIPVPDRATQQRVVAEVQQLTESKERLAHAHDAASARSAALRRSLFAAAFSGRLTDDREVANV